MAEETSSAQPPEAFSTDEIIDVYEHLAKRPEPWPAIWAEHGMPSKSTGRALEAIFPYENLVACRAAFALGLQFGAMRLAPVAFDEKESDDNCQCVICQFRRQVEAQARGESEEGPESQGGGDPQ